MIIARTLAAVATSAGLIAWVVFLRAGLVLSHYDAKAHLVVARRVIDSITPGWQQFGAVWLPLPHLIQFLPTQIDFFYRTGAFGSLLSIACFGIVAYAAARLVLVITGSTLGAAASTTLLVLNPNLLYLQATPMTEPLMLAITFMAVLWTYEWVVTNVDDVPTRLGVAYFAAAWSRYEAWPVIAAAIGAALFAAWRRHVPAMSVLRRAVHLAAWPAAAVLLFVINSRITVGSWFVTDGFFVPDLGYQGQAGRSLIAVWWGSHELSTTTTTTLALLGGTLIGVRAVMSRAEAPMLVPLALLAAGALPFYAFHAGHPFRIRYMIPMVAAYAPLAGLLVGSLRHGRVSSLAATALVSVMIGVTLLQSPPWKQDAPMLLEAQWDRPASQARRAVTVCLAPGYRGEKVLASMGSLAHYMQELSLEGFALRDFVHEGNGVIWQLALETGPAPHAGWMLVEEQAEGGDVLAQRIRRDPLFTRGMTRICEGGGVALYRRSIDQTASRP
ncbi:MAG: hypothetical protein EXQ48_02095 [Acidobacteria bacterium]|nr:hypothetical protein [Acidobacteriota bacterium]